MQGKSIIRYTSMPRAGLLATALVLGDLAANEALAAMPVARPPQVPGAVVLVQAENDAAAPFDELNAALEAARVKLDQLTGAAEVAALAQKLRGELEEARSESARLRAQMHELREAHEDARAEIAASAEDLAQRDARVETLEGQLEAAEQSLASARSLRVEAEQRLADLQEVVDSALGEAAELGQAMAKAKQDLAERNEEAARLRSERDEARQQLVQFREQADGLQQQLADAKRGLDQRDEENAGLRQQVAELQEAAQSARDAAQQNLQAVEDKIKLLNDAIAGIRGPASDQPAPQTRQGRIMPLPPTAAPSAARELSPIRAANATEGRELQSLQIRETAAPRERPATLVAYAHELPMEKRVQVQSLLADLKAEPVDDGLLMRVPGEDLFQLDSEQIESTAHDALVKVAELISLYEDRAVEIVGHTDAMGDANYNQNLSERRARLVRDFFVENFEIEAARLKVKGLGEREPIATNTTQAGRRANRRLEVIIRN